MLIWQWLVLVLVGGWLLLCIQGMNRFSSISGLSWMLVGLQCCVCSYCCVLVWLLVVFQVMVSIFVIYWLQFWKVRLNGQVLVLQFVFSRVSVWWLLSVVFCSVVFVLVGRNISEMQVCVMLLVLRMKLVMFWLKMCGFFLLQVQYSWCIDQGLLVLVFRLMLVWEQCWLMCWRFRLEWDIRVRFCLEVVSLFLMMVVKCSSVFCLVVFGFFVVLQKCSEFVCVLIVVLFSSVVVSQCVVKV